MINAVVGHMVGDYLFQTDYLALNKKRSSTICAIHCLVWTTCVMSFAFWWSLQAFLFLFLTHFIQDRTHIVSWWMSKMGQNQFKKPPFTPWSIIVVDNTLHLVQIWVAWNLWH